MLNAGAQRDGLRNPGCLLKCFEFATCETLDNFDFADESCVELVHLVTRNPILHMACGSNGSSLELVQEIATYGEFQNMPLKT